MGVHVQDLLWITPFRILVPLLLIGQWCISSTERSCDGEDEPITPELEVPHCPSHRYLPQSCLCGTVETTGHLTPGMVQGAIYGTRGQDTVFPRAAEWYSKTT